MAPPGDNAGTDMTMVAGGAMVTMYAPTVMIGTVTPPTTVVVVVVTKSPGCHPAVLTTVMVALPVVAVAACVDTPVPNGALTVSNSGEYLTRTYPVIGFTVWVW